MQFRQVKLTTLERLKRQRDKSNLVLPVQITHSGNVCSIATLIDSSITGNFRSCTLVEKLELLQHPLRV